jgi:ribosome assembly protein 1
VLKQAWQEKVRTCLVINKIDRLITELRFTTTEAYSRLTAIVESVNAIISNFLVSEKLGAQEEVKEEDEALHYFSPETGNVAFASALDRWAFTPG